MGAVPSEHAGVWSALNDTIQQAGSVLGVAALGSVLASSFTGAMPASAAEAARHSKYGSCPVPRCRRSQWQDSAS
jgi:DHA2 family multidrug resistance protein-like MFS transporter